MPHDRRNILSSLPPTGPITKRICITIIATSVLGSVLGRKTGLSLSLIDYRLQGILDLEIWRLVTYPFVESTPFGLMLGTLIFWLFGRWFESAHGSKDFLRFFFLSAIGAGIIAIPLSYILNFLMLFEDMGIAQGPDVVVDAMLVALAINAPNANVLLGFVIPIRARTIVYIAIAIELLGALMTGASTLSISLGGMAMGYLLTTGNWRPERLRNLLAHLLWKQKLKKRRKDFYVVPPDEKTFH
tara:strand:+ start:284 stop:1012 length:729 start_codon:yes stop_codon:yes gene_type:complete